MSVVVPSIANIILNQFRDLIIASRWKAIYGTFCSQHSEAVSLYKNLFKTDTRFQKFVQECRNNPFLNKLSITDCLLTVAQRITKYPIMIEAMIKTAKERPDEQQKLTNCLYHVKKILVNVNGQVASFKYCVWVIKSIFRLGKNRKVRGCRRSTTKWRVKAL